MHVVTRVSVRKKNGAGSHVLEDFKGAKCLSTTGNANEPCDLVLPKATSLCCFDSVLQREPSLCWHTGDGDQAGYLGQFGPLGIDFAEIPDEDFTGR